MTAYFLQMLRVTKLREVTRNDLFPSADMIVSMSREFGVPLTAEDFGGRWLVISSSSFAYLLAFAEVDEEQKGLLHFSRLFSHLAKVKETNWKSQHASAGLSWKSFSSLTVCQKSRFNLLSWLKTHVGISLYIDLWSYLHNTMCNSSKEHVCL